MNAYQENPQNTATQPLGICRFIGVGLGKALLAPARLQVSGNGASRNE